ncbi:Baculoviral IAP repeat-containing protein 3 [Colletotrichum siamense]|uniref:Baculoviral IAP repeat-containing protein 3 n=1 Tax=Colletotrichum siamense TaxID=690259 RepID=UPI001872246C|nr:Baculoviral IAP repeat-containing protein 3 [Colletotrichum siamense]KAF5497011.1 Baculoviral IAP repeat-containing protein 3 [Colletotrichum siamense]
MDTYFERLFTFHTTGSESGDGEGMKWPINTLRPEDMAGAGFYYTGIETKTSDSVTCFSCQMQAWKWKRKDNPFTEHSTGSPKCEYVTTQQFDDRHNLFLMEKEGKKASKQSSPDTLDGPATPPETPTKPKTIRRPKRKMAMSPIVTIYDSAPADNQAQNAVHHDTGRQPVEIAITAGNTKFTIQVTDVSPRGNKRLRVD